MQCFLATKFRGYLFFFFFQPNICLLLPALLLLTQQSVRSETLCPTVNISYLGTAPDGISKLIHLKECMDINCIVSHKLTCEPIFYSNILSVFSHRYRIKSARTHTHPQTHTDRQTDTHRQTNKHTHTHTQMHSCYEQQSLLQESHILTAIKSGYAVTSVLKCCWHLEQGEGISITQ